MERHRIYLARAVILAMPLFIGGWIFAGLLQDSTYSPARHDISDLGALTARAPWVLLLPQGLAGALTMAFALGALRPALRVAGRGEPISARLVAMSLMGLDNLTDPFFRLNCMAADLGCTPAVAAASWSGTIHVVIAIITALVTAAAPFALARRLRVADGWSDLAPQARAFGWVFAALLVLFIGLTGSYGAGWVQRIMTAQLAVGIVVLARRVCVR